MEKRVYVDWKKISLLIHRADIDLDDYGGSEINYLAHRTGRPWSTVSRIRSEGTTTLKTIGELAEALDCNPIDLVTTEGFRDPVIKNPGRRLDYSIFMEEE